MSVVNLRLKPSTAQKGHPVAGRPYNCVIVRVVSCHEYKPICRCTNSSQQRDTTALTCWVWTNRYIADCGRDRRKLEWTVSSGWGYLCNLHCEPKKKHTKMFWLYLPPNHVDSDKIWYTLSWINLRYHSLNVFQLTCIVSLQQLELRTQKHTKCFLSHRLQNQADSDKILYLLSWIYLSQSIVNIFHLT